MEHITISKRNELLRIPFAKAMFYEAFGNYCYGVFPNKQKVMLTISLAELDKLIHKAHEANQPDFIRVGKRFIINADRVVQINVTQGKLVLSDFVHEGNFALPIAKEAAKELKLYFENTTTK